MINKTEYNCHDDTYFIDRSRSATRSRSRNSSLSSSSSQRYTSRNGSSSPYRTSQQPSRSSSRGRSRHSTKSRRPSSKSINRDPLLTKINNMMYTSIKSPYFPMHENIEWPYYRPLSPNTRRYYDEHVFYPSNDPHRFQDVLSTNRCLRCYSSNHEGKSCPVFDYPTPRLCPFCRFLYHDEQDCIYKDEHIYDSDLSDHSSTRSSRSCSPLSSSLPTSRPMTPTHYNENVHYSNDFQIEDSHTHYSNIHDTNNHYQNEYQ